MHRIGPEALSGRSRKGQRSVDGPLEDESHVAVAGAELLGAEGAGGVEGVRAVWKRDLTPERGRLLGADVSTRAEGVSGWGRVDVKTCFAAQPQRYVRPAGTAHRALALGPAPGPAPLAPIVVAVHVSALQVRPWLLFGHGALASAHARERQRVEAHGTLRPCCVQLLPQRLQVFQSRCASETLSGAPQQRSTTQVNQGTVRQLLRLALHLMEHRIRENKH